MIRGPGDVVIIICTRVGSSRLPGKVFKKIAGIPALQHILDRLPNNLPVILAVPEGEGKHFVPMPALGRNVRVFEGSPDSPLHRMYEAALSLGHVPTYVVRITHDDILIDTQAMRDLIARVQAGNAGYGVSDGILEGAGVEVIHMANLAWAAEHTRGPVEHISYFVRGPGLPNPRAIRAPVRDSIRRPYRLTMDYPEDAVVLETVLRELGPLASNDDICRFLDNNPHILRHNRLPEVTIYTCAYNAAPYIYDCMSSVADNGFGDMEYIVVEDGSTDSTLKEIMHFSALRKGGAVPLRVIVNDENVGLASSSNIAISQARGRYILRVDADDILIHGALSEMLRIAQAESAAVVYPDYHVIDADATILESHQAGHVHHHAGGALMDKRLLNEVKFRDGLRHWDSIDLFKRLKERFRIAYFQHPGFLYRRHAANLSRVSPEREHVLDGLRSSWAVADTVTSAIINP
jgi:spore coat polysaccharide biosynthesis protein SpsF (cytidylyltransferase family)